MAGNTKKTPAKKAVTPKKSPVPEAVQKAMAGEDAPKMVQAMHPDAFRLAVEIVNRADIKGSDAETIMLLKRELARVAGQT